MSLLTCGKEKNVGEVCNGFLLERAKGVDVRCRFCGEPAGGDGHLLWDGTFLLIVHVCELPEFLLLMTRVRSNWPRWRRRLLGFGVGGDRALWADSLGQLAVRSLETVLGSHPVVLTFWDAEDSATEIGDHSCVWTDEAWTLIL